jgi:hypothetical protein
MPPDQSQLVEAAMRLRATAPEPWELFLKALSGYASAVNGEMLRCAPEMLQRAQGMAIGTNEIASVLTEAPTTYEKLRAFRRDR